MTGAWRIKLNNEIIPDAYGNEEVEGIQVGLLIDRLVWYAEPCSVKTGDIITIECLLEE